MSTAVNLATDGMKALDFKDEMRKNLEEKMKSMPEKMSELEKIRSIARSTRLGKKWLGKYSSRKRQG